MSDPNHIALAEDLDALGLGTISAREFRAKYCERLSWAMLATIWPNLEHYSSDEDIRQRDAQYRAMQNAGLRKLAKLVREEAPDSELAAVTFLVPSAEL